MPLFEEKTHPQQNQTPTGGSETTQKSNQNQKTSGLMTIIGQLLPLAPLAFEQFTGQKVPSLTGTMAEVQMALIQISTNLQVVTQRLTVLETKLTEISTNANQHLTNLTHQFNSLRLTHTKEQKRIELHSNGSDFDKSRQFDRPQLENSPENY